MQRDARVIYRVAELFFQGKSAPAIADMINKELQPHPALSRLDVYPLLALARKRQLVRLVPPISEEYARRLALLFKGLVEDNIRVVDTLPDVARERIAAVTAALVVELAKKLKKPPSTPVGLGLGPGQATLEFSVHCAAMIRADPDAPNFKLFALSAGCPADAPQLTPMSFFNVYPPNRISGCVGLFAETLVPAKAYSAVVARPGVREAFAQRDEIDIVVTAMGDMERPGHDLFTAQLGQADVDIGALKAQGWIGNVQYRPFTRDGPVIETGRALRAVTLFELADLRNLAQQRNKHVVLMARQRGSEADMPHALLALLQQPQLRVFSELIIDMNTAAKLEQLVAPRDRKDMVKK